MEEYKAQRLSYTEIERLVREGWVGGKASIEISADGYWVINGVKTEFKAEVEVPVQSVNGQTGDVELTATDVGARPNTWTPTAAEVKARPDTWTPTYSEVGADKSGTASSAVNAHNANKEAHNDIRTAISALQAVINEFFAEDADKDANLDRLVEIVKIINSNKESIDDILTDKVNVSDIINDLKTDDSAKPLSAAQGKALKGLIDVLSTGKLDASALSSAINTALAQAKANGEFDGAPGKDGVTPTIEISADGYWVINGKKTTTKAAGTNGDDGEDGVGILSITKTGTSGKVDTYTIAFTDDRTATFTVTNGTDGAPGYTPIYGLDFFTPTEKANIIKEVLEAIGTPVYGRIEGSNNIILSGDVPNGTYYVKYKNTDGTYSDTCTIKVGEAKTYTVTKSLTNCTINTGSSNESVLEGSIYTATVTANTNYEISSITVKVNGVVISNAVSGKTITIAVTGDIVIDAVATKVAPAYVNLLDTAYDTDLKTVYNGVGYKMNVRMKSTGIEESTEQLKVKNCLTGLILRPSVNDVYHIRGVDSVVYQDGGYCGYYSAWNGGTMLKSGIAVPTNNAGVLGTDENGDFTLKVTSAWTFPEGTNYIRLQLGTVTGEFIITKNQLIPK